MYYRQSLYCENSINLVRHLNEFMYDILGEQIVCYIIDKHGIMIFNLLK